ncbi:MAG: protein serine/threonine phosphatase 2C family protein [Candidatus Yanofskybacteria bacterium]|nr:protein serine/threonine phosphatase 2C family protein [Candidatus Yanofskybacteria bacterium]
MLRGKVTFDSNQGARFYQEDRYIALRPQIKGNFSGWLLAVMDGHGGSEVSEFCLDNIPNIFFKATNLGRQSVNEAILKQIVGLLAKETNNMEAGSTLSLVYVDEVASVARVAVLGDSPVVVRDSTGKIVLSPEHNVRTNGVELEAAKKRGAIYDPRGYICNSEGYTQLSRALGDRIFSDFVSHEPETYSVNLGPDSFVLVASDGLVDPAHGDTESDIESLIDSIADQIDKGATAKDLVDNAVNIRKTKDNATAVLWRASS